MENEIIHGLYATYTNAQCRCPECRKAAADYMRNYRKTATGKTQARYHQALSNRRSQIAIQWIKENHPDKWESICAIASQETESKLKEEY
jgi:hypothetical protein